MSGGVTALGDILTSPGQLAAPIIPLLEGHGQRSRCASTTSLRRHSAPRTRCRSRLSVRPLPVPPRPARPPQPVGFAGSGGTALWQRPARRATWRRSRPPRRTAPATCLLSICTNAPGLSTTNSLGRRSLVWRHLTALRGCTASRSTPRALRQPITRSMLLAERGSAFLGPQYPQLLPSPAGVLLPDGPDPLYHLQQHLRLSHPLGSPTPRLQPSHYPPEL